MRRKLLTLLFAGICLVGGPTLSLALDLSGVRTAVRRNVRDTASSSSLRRYSDATLLAYINEAQRSVINDTWASSDSSTQTITAGATYYSIPTEALVVWRVTLDSAQLVQLDLKQLDADNNNSAWLTTAGTSPTGYFIDRSNRTQLGVTPIPSSSGSVLKIFYWQLVPDLSSDSDIPFDSDVRLYSYHDLLVYHATYRILLSENRVQEADIYKDLYNGGVELMNMNVGHKPQRPVIPSKEVKP